MMEGFDGEIAISPIEGLPAASKTGVQVVPPFTVFMMPPAARPT